MPTTLKTMAPLGITAVKAFTPNTDTLAANGDAASVTYGVNNTALLTVVWSSLADGVYDCVYFAGTTPVASDIITVAGATTTAQTSPTLAEIWTTVQPEAYRATGTAGTPAQLLHEIVRHLTDAQIAGTTKTINNLAGSPVKTYTLTLDGSGNPTAITEAT